MQIALKIDISHDGDVSAGIAPLLDMLERYEVKATFFVSPPKTRGWRLLSGKNGAFQTFIDALSQRGHEIGAAPLDAGVWKERILEMDRHETETEISRAVDLFHRVGRTEHLPWSSPGNRINADVPLLLERFGVLYASDTRGLTPFRPVTVAGRSSCIQIPTTLPLVSELIRQGVPQCDIHQYIFMESQKPLPTGHVFAIEFESDKPPSLEVFEKLIVMWKGAHWTFSTLGEMYRRLDPKEVPEHEVGLHRVQGGAESIAIQGPKVGL